MMAKPIFCVTHPRACSTAFERVFMTRTEDLTCEHEPFGDAFYYGPERMSSRFEDRGDTREESGFADTTFETVVSRIESDTNDEGKRVFVKDIIYYLFPPNAKPAQIAPSLISKRRGIGTKNGVTAPSGALGKSLPFPFGTDSEPGNPTVIPLEVLKKYHFTFLIRDPHSSIPSFYRCTIPPLAEYTKFGKFCPSEAGYDEVRRMFDFCVATGQVGPERAGASKTTSYINGTEGYKEQLNGYTNGMNGHTNGVDGHINGINGRTNGTHSTNGINGHTNGMHSTNGTNGHTNGMNGTNGINGHTSNGNLSVEICMVDADDLLDNPEGIIKEYCRSVGLKYDPIMLDWSSEEAHHNAVEAFEKWKGWHEDALHSSDLKPRTHKKKQKTEEEWDAEWRAKYGEEGAKVIRDAVDANMEDYLYLKQFAMKV